MQNTFWLSGNELCCGRQSRAFWLVALNYHTHFVRKVFAHQKFFSRKFRMFVPQGYPPPPLMEIWYAKKISGIEQYFPSPLDCSLSLFFFVPQEKNMTIKLARLTTQPPPGGPPPTVLWREDNFVFSQIWMFRYMWHRSVFLDILSHIWWMKTQFWGSKF